MPELLLGGEMPDAANPRQSALLCSLGSFAAIPSSVEYGSNRVLIFLQTANGNEMAFETTDEIMHLCDIVRQTGFDLRKYLGHGHLEKG